MEKGSYAKKVDFASMRVEKFTPHFFSTWLRALNGCGSTALAILTGDDPVAMPHLDHWSSGHMRRYLKKRKFTVVRLTKRNVTNYKEPTYPITAAHVVLASIKFIKGESSWIILHNGKIYHNFEVSDCKPYEFLNHPITDAYVLDHPSWSSLKFKERLKAKVGKTIKVGAARLPSRRRGRPARRRRTAR